MLARLLKQYDIPSLIVFRPYKVGTYFSLKSQVPYSLKAGVVYRYVCPVNSGISYIGKTSRHFFKRVKEHVAPERNSPILNHMLECSAAHIISRTSTSSGLLGMTMICLYSKHCILDGTDHR